MTNEKCYLVGKFARVGLRHAPHRLQRAAVHVVGRDGVLQGVRHRPVAAADDRHPARRLASWSPARTSPSASRSMMQWIWQARDRGASLIVSTRARRRSRVLPTSGCRSARHRCGAAERDAAPGDRGRPGRRGVSGRPYDRLGRRPRGRPGVHARRRRADHRRAGRADRGRRPAVRPRANLADHARARDRAQHPRRRTTAWPASTWRLPGGRSASRAAAR